MRILIDTHCWLWSLAEPDRLSREAHRILASRRTVVFLSAASAWEMAIKVSIGKLDLPEPVESYVPSRMALQGVRPLPISHTHALKVSTLPGYHRDPFDRLLVAQSMVEQLPVLTADPVFERYGAEVVPA